MQIYRFYVQLLVKNMNDEIDDNTNLNNSFIFQIDSVDTDYIFQTDNVEQELNEAEKEDENSYLHRFL